MLESVEIQQSLHILCLLKAGKKQTKYFSYEGR